MEERDKFQKQLIGILAKHQLDAFVFPDCKIAAPKFEDVLKPRWRLMDFPMNALLASNGGMPAITQPAKLGRVMSDLSFKEFPVLAFGLIGIACCPMIVLSL